MENHVVSIEPEFFSRRVQHLGVEYKLEQFDIVQLSSTICDPGTSKTLNWGQCSKTQAHSLKREKEASARNS